MEVTAITDLVMNDVCKNKADAFQVAFYKVDDVKKIITIIDSLDKHNCNKFRIDDFNWISRNKDNILKLPDIIIADKSKLTLEELETLIEYQIKVFDTEEMDLNDTKETENQISDIKATTYEQKINKYFELTEKLIKEIEEKYASNEFDNNEVINELINDILKLLKEKDDITYDHVTNVSKSVDLFIDGMPEEERFSEEEITFLKNAALVHDIGKLLIPNQILRKKEKLNEIEYERMQEHVSDDAYLFNNELMVQYKEVALCHHERYDGKGYPNHLAGEEIPKFARVIAVLDAFDAMAGNRPYIDLKTFDELIDVFKTGAEKQFDPKFAEYWINAMIKHKDYLLETYNIKQDGIDLNDGTENDNIEMTEGGIKK